MDALTLHYYTHPGGWLNKGAATGFDKETEPLYFENRASKEIPTSVDEDDDNESSVLDVPPFLRPRKF